MQETNLARPQPEMNDVASMYEQAAALIEAKDYDRALGVLQEILAIDPQHGMANFQVGEMALKAQQSQLAHDYLIKAIMGLTHDVRDADARPELWMALLAAQFYVRSDDLRESGKRAVDRARDGKIAAEGLAERLNDMGQHESAVLAARLAADATPERVEPLILLARAAMETDDQEGALKALTRAKELGQISCATA